MCVRYQDVLADITYQRIHDACYEGLVHEGSFQKEEILKYTGFHLFADAVRWDYVQRMIVDLNVLPISVEANAMTDLGQAFIQAYPKNANNELLPMAMAFFSKKPRDRKGNAISRANDPQKFVARGHGKKTYGYALLTPATQDLAGVLIGIDTARSVQTTATTLNRAGAFIRQGVRPTFSASVRQGLQEVGLLVDEIGALETKNAPDELVAPEALF